MRAVAKIPQLLVLFILALVLIRTVPIVISLTLRKSTRKEISMHNRISAATYCTTALPLIVAITGICVKNGIMEDDVASVLVAAGAVTVFLMPFIAKITYTVADAEPISAIVEIAHHPESTMDIVHSHVELERKRALKYKMEEKGLLLHEKWEDKKENLREKHNKNGDSDSGSIL